MVRARHVSDPPGLVAPAGPENLPAAGLKGVPPAISQLGTDGTTPTSAGSSQQFRECGGLLVLSEAKGRRHGLGRGLPRLISPLTSQALFLQPFCQPSRALVLGLT